MLGFGYLNSMNSYWYDDETARVERRDALPETTDTVVVGAGITGLTTALLLARAGKNVVVLEARQVGDVTTGRTTGKISLLQGTKLSRMLRTQSPRVARSYLAANMAGQDWLLEFCAERSVPVQTRDAITFASSPQERQAAKDEYDATQQLGLPTGWIEKPDLGFAAYGATVLRGQAQIDPAPLLRELVAAVTELGGVVRENSRVVSVSKVGRPVVATGDGQRVRCDDVVLATGTPILDRGLYFAKVEANRSYVLMFADAQAPGSMLLSAGSPAFSVRDVPGSQGESLLMVGGNGHVVGRTGSERRHLNGLRMWASSRFPGAREIHSWSAQDYSSHDGIPFVGKLPRGQGHVHLATGFDKWGLTNGVAAALRLAGEIAGEQPEWARPMGHRITRPRGALDMLTANAKVGLALTRGLVGAELKGIDSAPAEGHGQVGRRGLDPTPVATSTVDGRACTVTGLCTHLGGVLKWNDAERSWDCPLHGSRFAPDGSVLEGPATKPLGVRKGPE